MSTTLERIETKKRGSAWHKEFPLNPEKVIFQKETAVPYNVNAELAKRIEEFDISNAPFPIWKEELTQDFKALNEARLRYQSLRLAKHTDYWLYYSEESKEKIENLIRNYEWVKGAWSSVNVSTAQFLESHQRLNGQRDPFETAVEKFETAREPRDRLVEHARLWATWILAEQKVDFRPQEVKNLVAKAAENTIRLLLISDLTSKPEKSFLDELKGGIKTQLQKPDSPEISFVPLKPGSNQEKGYALILMGFSNEEIEQTEILSSAVARNVRESLKKHGITTKLPDKKHKKLRQQHAKKMLAENPQILITFQTAWKEKHERCLSQIEYDSLETRLKKSDSHGGIAKKLINLYNIDFSNYVFAEIIKESSIEKVRNCLEKMRSHKDAIPMLTKIEPDLQGIKSRTEKLIDKKIYKIKTSIYKDEQKTQKDLIYYSRIASLNILKKAYSLNLLTNEQQEDLVERVAKSVLENYEPNENQSFHAQVAVWISQNLPESPIFGKINRDNCHCEQSKAKQSNLLIPMGLPRLLRSLAMT